MKTIHCVYANLLQPGDTFNSVRRRLQFMGLKATNAFNEIIREPHQLRMNMEDLRFKKFGFEEFAQVKSDPEVWRYIASFFIDGNPSSESIYDSIGGFRHRIYGCEIVGGFRRSTSNPLFGKKLPPDCGCNAVMIDDGKSVCITIGSGEAAINQTMRMLRSL